MERLDPRARTDDNVLIVGGGVAGLSAALALWEAGLACRVVEARAGPPAMSEGFGLQLGPNATRLLEAWGVLSRLGTAATEVDAVAFMDWKSGRELNRFSLGSQVRKRHGAPYLTTSRAALVRALSDCLACPDAATRGPQGSAPRSLLPAPPTIAYRQVLDRLNPREGGSGVTIRLGNGERREILAKTVIGADGANSRVRLACARTRTLPVRRAGAPGPMVWRARVAGDEVRASGSEIDVIARRFVCVWPLPGGSLVHYPIAADGELNVVLNGHLPAHAVARSPPAGLLSRLPAFFQRLAERKRFRSYSVFAMERPAWPVSRPGLTLVGDAAHALRPHLAQGAAMGIEDGCVLAAKLRTDSPAHGNASGWLRRFERARLARVARVMTYSRRMGTWFHLGEPFCRLRDHIVGTLPPSWILDHHAWIHDGPILRASPGMPSSRR